MLRPEGLWALPSRAPIGFLQKRVNRSPTFTAVRTLLFPGRSSFDGHVVVSNNWEVPAGPVEISLLPTSQPFLCERRIDADTHIGKWFTQNRMTGGEHWIAAWKDERALECRSLS